MMNASGGSPLHTSFEYEETDNVEMTTMHENRECEEGQLMLGDGSKMENHNASDSDGRCNIRCRFLCLVLFLLAVAGVAYAYKNPDVSMSLVGKLLHSNVTVVTMEKERENTEPPSQKTSFDDYVLDTTYKSPESPINETYNGDDHVYLDDDFYPDDGLYILIDDDLQLEQNNSEVPYPTYNPTKSPIHSLLMSAGSMEEKIIMDEESDILASGDPTYAPSDIPELMVHVPL